MSKLKAKVVWIWTKICFFVTAIFYVLFLQKKKEDAEDRADRIEAEKKEEEKVLKEKAAAQDEEAARIEEEGNKEVEKITENLNSSNADAAIAASDKLLDDLRKKGRERNRV